MKQLLWIILFCCGPVLGSGSVFDPGLGSDSGSGSDSGLGLSSESDSGSDSGSVVGLGSGSVVGLGSSSDSSSSSSSGSGGPAARPRQVDYRYAPDWHVSTPAFPDDSCKTLVGPLGQLLYDYGGKTFYTYALEKGFRTVIHFLADEGEKFSGQQLRSARIPIVETDATYLGMSIRQETFCFAADYMRKGVSTTQGNREDVVLTTVVNSTPADREIRPLVVIDSDHPVTVENGQIRIGGKCAFTLSEPIVRVRKNLGEWKTIVELAPVTVGAGQRKILAGVYDNGLPSRLAADLHRDPAAVVAGMPALRDRTAAYWENNASIPYGRIQVPDREIQNLIDASIRGIWQAREIKEGNYSFQVGPTCYRGLWIVDGAFLLETATLLGRGDEARDGIDYMLSFQKENGEFAKLNPTFWKENGLVLWACVRHALLTQDKAWLRSVWSRLSKTVDFIHLLRRRTLLNDNPLDDGLMPPGYIDGGLNGGADQAEYSNVVWNLSGMKAMIQAARWIGENRDADRWQSEYDDFYAAFRRAARRDRQTDAFGNTYLPVVMDPKYQSLPQRAQWAFCQSIYPGQLFPPGDSLAEGTLGMLHTTLQEGMVMGTGWIPEGIWNYFAGFYGHACLWLGESSRAADALYAFANHASELYVWREEHNPRDLPRNFVGDMPHNWGSAEFIRLAVHLLAIDRGDELHLLEGIPEEWLEGGMQTSLTEVATPFGPLTFRLSVAADGRTATLHVDRLSDPSCRAVYVRLKGWGTDGGKDPIRLDPRKDNCIVLGKIS